MDHLDKQNDEIAAMLARNGVDPDQFLGRKETAALYKSFGINISAQTLAKIACTTGDGPEYQVIFGRAVMRPRAALEWAFSRASKPRRASFGEGAV
jgi:hypothetical protein